MKKYILKRLIGIIPMIVGISLISFFVIHLATGSPVDAVTDLNIKVSLEAKEKLIAEYGLDKPIIIQYMNWLRRIVFFDFGNSYRDGRKVLIKISERIPITLLINVFSLILILLVAVPIGVTSAVKKDSIYDKCMTVFVFIGFAMPGFWLALILMSVFGLKLGWLPVQGITSLEFETFTFFGKIADVVKHLVLPVFVSALGALAGMSRYMRSNMLEVLDKDYIRTARAKGLPESVVVYKHALKNALLPVITILGLSIPGLIGGSVIFESVFGIPGVGRLFYESVMARDYPVIMAMLIVGAFLTLIGNLVADISYSVVDPRIQIDK
ncbi:MAG: ABC transporter permease [Candidatus Omnitrophota bacterium]